MEPWQELSEAVADRLAAASTDDRAVFAVGVAERLLRQHEALPEAERAPFTISQRRLLDSLWAGVLGDPAAFTEIKQRMAAYLLSDYCHNDGQDGPADADEPAAAAVLIAADAYMYGCADFAVWVSGRALEAIDDHVPEDGFDDAAVAELRRQLSDLDLIPSRPPDLRESLSQPTQRS